MSFTRIVRSSEDTINELMGEYLRSQEMDELGQSLVSQLCGGSRKPDFSINIDSNYYFGEGEWEDSLLAGYDQARIYNELHGSSGSFLIIYPNKLHEIIENKPHGPANAQELLGMVNYDLWILIPEKDVRCFNKISLDQIPSKIIDTFVNDIYNIDDEMLLDLLSQTVGALRLELQNPTLLRDRRRILSHMLGGPPANEHTMERVQAAASYLLIDQLAFYRVLSHYQEDLFPPIDINSLNNFDELQHYFDNALEIDYDSIFSVRLASTLQHNTFSLIIKILKIINMMPPDFLIGGRLGTIFHKLIPLEIRKPLAAYYTLPIAAEILAKTAIDDSNIKFIDPACGSGSLLTAGYLRLKELISLDSDFTEEDHIQLLTNQIVGIDFMPFAAHLSAIHLAIQYPHHLSENIRIGIIDSMTLKKGKKIPPLSTHLSKIQALGQTSLTAFQEGDPFESDDLQNDSNDENNRITISDYDLVIMNPPFTRFQNMANFRLNYIRALSRYYFSNLDKYIDGKMSFSNYFVLKSDELIKNHGKMAAVLPATVLVGDTTKGIRRYISEKYNIDVIFIRDDHCRFSEDTDLQEIMIILEKKNSSDRRTQNHVDYVILHQFDSGFVDNIKTKIKSDVEPGNYPNDNFTHRRVRYSELSIDNFFKPIALSQYSLYELTDIYQKNIPLIELKNYISENQNIFTKNSPEPNNTMRFNQSIIHMENSTARRRIWNFLRKDGINIYCKFANEGEDIIPIRRNNCRMVFRSRADINKISINDVEEHILYSNPGNRNRRFFNMSRMHDVNWDRWKQYLDGRTSRLGLVDRIDVTSPNSTLLAYCDDNDRIWSRIVAGITNLTEKEAKIFSMWFNSTFGIIDYFLNRSPQRAYLQIHKSGIEKLKVPNIAQLSQNQINDLLKLYDEISEEQFPSLIDQFTMLSNSNFINRELIDERFGNSNLIANGFDVRSKLDKEFIRILGGDLNHYNETCEKFYSDCLNAFIVFSNFMKK